MATIAATADELESVDEVLRVTTIGYGLRELPSRSRFVRYCASSVSNQRVRQLKKVSRPPSNATRATIGRASEARAGISGSPSTTVDNAVSASVAADGAAIVLRLGLFYGPGAAHSEQMFSQARRHIGMVPGAPEGYLSSIHSPTPPPPPRPPARPRRHVQYRRRRAADQA
jgi:hypothetical protein